jgi:hypothetical protein
MTLDQLKEIMKASLDSYGEGYFGEDDVPDTLLCVEDGDWISEGKYQHQDCVYADDEGNYFMISNSRSGSYHTDWYYNTPTITQVERVVKMVETTTWEAV